MPSGPGTACRTLSGIRGSSEHFARGPSFTLRGPNTGGCSRFADQEAELCVAQTQGNVFVTLGTTRGDMGTHGRCRDPFLSLCISSVSGRCARSLWRPRTLIPEEGQRLRDGSALAPSGLGRSSGRGCPPTRQVSRRSCLQTLRGTVWVGRPWAQPRLLTVLWWEGRNAGQGAASVLPGPVPVPTPPTPPPPKRSALTTCQQGPLPRPLPACP